MKQKEVRSEQERFQRMLTGIPEEEYPRDLLDEVILKGVEKVFPHPVVKSQILLLNIELQDLRREQEQTQKTYNIRVEPEISDLINYQGFIQSIRILEIPLTLYHSPIRLFNDCFNNEYPTVKEPLPEWIQNYGILEKLKNETLRSMTDVITELS